MDLISFGNAASGYASMPVKQWKVADVEAFLQAIELGHVCTAIKENAVDGALLLELSDEELEKELGFKNLQIKRMKRELEALSSKAAGGVTAATATADAAQAAAQAAQAAQAAAQAAQAAQAAEAAKESEAAQAAAAQAAKSQAAQAYAARFAAAQQYLGGAAKDLQEAQQHLHKALTSQAVDMGMGMRPFHHERAPVLGMAMAGSAHNHCKAAHQLAEKASAQIKEARARCPELPNIRVPDVHVVGGILAQEIFDSTVADAIRVSKIKGAEGEIVRCAKEVKEAYERCGATAGAAQAAVAPAPAPVYAPPPAPAYAAPPAGYPPAGYPPAPAPGYYPAPAPVYYPAPAPAPEPAPAPAPSGGGARAVAGGVLLGAAIADRHHPHLHPRPFGRRF